MIDLDNLNNSHSLIIRLTGNNKRVLEVGTSTGYVTKVLRDHGNSVVGIEYDKDAGDIAKQYCEKMIIGDIEAINLDDYIKGSSFDVIIFGDVLEHLRSPGIVIQNVKKFLNPDGYLVVSIPNVCHGDVIINLLLGDFNYKPVGLLDITHLRFFGLKNIIELFNRSGYAVENINRTTAPVGSTELKADVETVPQSLFEFIDQIPDANVYQFVFTATPGVAVESTDVVDRRLVELFEGVLNKRVNERTNTLDLEIERLNSRDREAVERIKAMGQQIIEQDTRIAGLNEQNQVLSLRSQELTREIGEMKRSMVWQLLMKYHHGFVDRFLPLGKKRRVVYDKGLSGGRIIANEGLKGLITVAKGLRKSSKKLSDYEIWISRNEPSPKVLKRYSKEANKFEYRPKISIVTPVYNPDVTWIKSAIESVLKQAYDNWELCLADASTREDVKKCLKKYAKKDSRIKVDFLAQNKGISGNSNSALALATGEYVGLLDHDDMLTPDALYEVVKHLQTDQKADMIYSDEDKIDLDDNRRDPFFKPDWSPDTFLSIMYTCHFGVYRKDIIDKIGGFREGYDGSQDYDLVLRFIENTNNIYHIPKILYHWRAVPGSTAATADIKKYAFTSAKKALSDYLKRNNIQGEVVDGFWTGSYHVKRRLTGSPLVSIIIPTKDKVEVLRRCIDSILSKTDYRNYEIIIINNNSLEEKTYDYFEELRPAENIKILDYKNGFNFSAINNFAVHHSSGEMIVLLNNDTEIISPEWLTAMLEHAQRPEVGAVGCKLLYPDDTVQHAGVILGLYGGEDGNRVAGHGHCHLPATSHGYFGRVNIIQDLSAVTAACMMMRREVFMEIGEFDDELAIAFNDVDLCLKIRQKGYEIVYTPYASLYHHESLSRGHEDTPEKYERFVKEVMYMRKKWGATIDAGDPYYNINLSLKYEDFRINI